MMRTPLVGAGTAFAVGGISASNMMASPWSTALGLGFLFSFMVADYLMLMMLKSPMRSLIAWARFSQCGETASTCQIPVVWLSILRCGA